MITAVVLLIIALSLLIFVLTTFKTKKQKAEDFKALIKDNPDKAHDLIVKELGKKWNEDFDKHYIAAFDPYRTEGDDINPSSIIVYGTKGELESTVGLAEQFYDQKDNMEKNQLLGNLIQGLKNHAQMKVVGIQEQLQEDHKHVYNIETKEETPEDYFSSLVYVDGKWQKPKN